MKIFFILITTVVFTGCYDPKLLIDLYNNSKTTIIVKNRIIKPNNMKTLPYSKDINITYKDKYKYCNYLYNINIDFGEDFSKIDKIDKMYNYPNLKLQLDNNKKIYFIYSNIGSFPVDKEDLKAMQPKGFPISPIKKESILNDKKSLK